jgi:hypothetical protein
MNKLSEARFWGGVIEIGLLHPATMEVARWFGAEWCTAAVLFLQALLLVRWVPVPGASE